MTARTPQPNAQPKYPVAPPPYYHGTKADLEVGELLVAGRVSNYGQDRTALWVYLTATLEAAIWGAELARGEGRGRIYIVEPAGPIEDDPNLTDKKFPGNITKSYRTREPLRVVGEVTDWTGHPAALLTARRERLAEMERAGTAVVEE